MTDKCIHHDRCRADHARGDLLCGWHHAKAWSFCIWFRDYESQVRLEKAQVSAVAKAIVILRPQVAVIENVSTILTSRHSVLISEFVTLLEQGGYNVENFTLNAITFGVPQSRKRVFFVLTNKPIDRELFEEDLEFHHQISSKVGEILENLSSPPVYMKGKKTKTLHPNHIAMNHSTRVRRKIAKIPVGKGPLSYRKLDPNSQSATLISGHRAPPVHYSQARAITSREALRLQGFPDSFIIAGSFGKQMEQVTNAVPLPLGYAVITTLLEQLEDNNG